MKRSMPRKQSSPKLSSLAARLLRRGKPDWMPAGYWTNVRSLAGSVLSQDEVRGVTKAWLRRASV